VSHDVGALAIRCPTSNAQALSTVAHDNPVIGGAGGGGVIADKWHLS
jgi:hypothetical protein